MIKARVKTRAHVQAKGAPACRMTEQVHLSCTVSLILAETSSGAALQLSLLKIQFRSTARAALLGRRFQHSHISRQERS